MKTATILKKYLNKRLTTIDTILKKPTRLFNINDFHNLRVELKKLNAFSSLINSCSKSGEEINLFKPFKKIFNHAGKVRDLQLQEQALGKYLLNYPITAYITNLKRLLVKEQINFFSLLKKREQLKPKQLNKKIIVLLNKLNKKMINEYLKKERAEIENIFNKKNLKIEQVHVLRKILKQLFYNYKTLEVPTQKKLLNKMHALQELMGKWHDARVVATNLKKAITSKTAIAEADQLKKIKQLFVTSAKMMLVRINQVKQAIEF